MKLVKWPEDTSRHQHTYHWCPACEELHPLPDRWTREGPDDAPTYRPSFVQHLKRGDCHYVITDGRMQYIGDSWHKRDDTIAMPDIPDDVAADLTAELFK